MTVLLEDCDSICVLNSSLGFQEGGQARIASEAGRYVGEFLTGNEVNVIASNGDDTFTIERNGESLGNVPIYHLEQSKIHLKSMISNGDLVPLET